MMTTAPAPTAIANDRRLLLRFTTSSGGVSSRTPSASATSGFVLSASNVEGSKDGLFFFGANGRQVNPWGNGTSYQCVVPPTSRAGLLTGVGTLGACDGSFAQDLNALWCAACPKPAKNPGAGAVVQAQLWYRDPQNSSSQTTVSSRSVVAATTRLPQRERSWISQT